MHSLSIKEQLLNEIDQLSDEEQQRVLDFARRLHQHLPPGIPGKDLIQLSQEINFSAEDLQQMAAAIEDTENGCEKIDWDEW